LGLANKRSTNDGSRDKKLLKLIMDESLLELKWPGSKWLKDAVLRLSGKIVPEEGSRLRRFWLGTLPDMAPLPGLLDGPACCCSFTKDFRLGVDSNKLLLLPEAAAAFIAAVAGMLLDMLFIAALAGLNDSDDGAAMGAPMLSACCMLLDIIPG
jgi:hypothetical protein